MKKTFIIGILLLSIFSCEKNKKFLFDNQKTSGGKSGFKKGKFKRFYIDIKSKRH